MTMRLYTVLCDGQEQVALGCGASGEGLCLLRDLGIEVRDMNDLICSGRIDEVRAKDPEKCAACRSMDSVKILAPIPEPRQDLVCLGVNYAEHAAESHRYNASLDSTATATVYFSKRVNRATAPGDPVPSYPGLVDSFDYEVELGVVIGKDAKDVSEEEALDHVFGYTIINDVSARNLQTRHSQWYRGKSLDGFTPMGPCIVTPEELGDVQDLAISCRINGELRQNSNTSLMLQSVRGAIAELSRGMTLKAGTVIATGTPAGVGLGMDPPGFLKSGDVMACAVEGIGELVNPVE